MITPNYDATDVRIYRDTHGCSMMEAKAHFHKKQIKDLIMEVRLTGDIKLLVDIVEELIDRESFR